MKDHLLEKFRLLKTITDIEAIQPKTPDGEDVQFEVKAVTSDFTKIKPSKDRDKTNIKEEICGLANTSGGILVITDFVREDKKTKKVKKAELKQFSKEPNWYANNALENFIKNCIEPRLSGIDVRLVDNLVAVYVPESKHKTHRTISDGRHMHRIGSSTEIMPEAMVSAMYRSNDHLAYDVLLHPHLFKDQKIMRLGIIVRNDSNICGTRPRVETYVYTEKHCRIESRAISTAPIDDVAHMNPATKTGIYRNAWVATNNKENVDVLYPHSKQETQFSLDLTDELIANKDWWIHVNAYFMESEGQSRLFYWDGSNGKMAVEVSRDIKDLSRLVEERAKSAK